MELALATRSAILLWSILVISSSYGSLLCRDGSLYWAPHDQCYHAETRGPCRSGEILIEKPEGPICISDYRSRLQTIKNHIRHRTRDNDIDDQFLSKKSGNAWNRQQSFFEQGEFKLPAPYSISYKERECYENFQIYWKPKNQCFPLLSSDACESPDEWLVLEADSYSGDVIIKCKQKPCVCRDLDLCEVELPKDSPMNCNRCMVSRAAAQHSICKENEQLYIDPFGQGKCGCLRDPLHVQYEGKCHLLFSQGPCKDGHTLQYSSLRKTTLCAPEICPDTSILHEDGHCYFLGTKGPCRDGEYFDADPESKNIICRKHENKREIVRKNRFSSPVKRVFDIIPKEGQPPECIRDSRGTCRNIINFDDSRIGKRQKQRTHSLMKESLPIESRLLISIPESVKTAEDFINWIRNLTELPPPAFF